MSLCYEILLEDSKKPIENLPDFLKELPAEFWAPEWWSMDHRTPSVYAVNIERSIKANKVLLDESYCMTKFLCGSMERNCRIWKDHTWIPAMRD